MAISDAAHCMLGPIFLFGGACSSSSLAKHTDRQTDRQTHTVCPAATMDFDIGTFAIQPQDMLYFE